MLDEIFTIIKLTDDKENRLIPPTIIYNENWLLRLVMWWFLKEDNFIINSDLDRKIVKAFKYSQLARFYSDVTIETQFKRRTKGVKDMLAEPSINVSGVLGNYTIIHKRKSDRVKLNLESKQFNVFVVNMYNELSKGVKNQSTYNQVARAVGCIVQTLYKANITLIENTGLYIIAPKVQIKLNSYKVYSDRNNIEEEIKNRIDQYGEDENKNKWYTYFNKIFQRVDVACIAWEEIILFVKKNDNEFGNKLQIFYEKCEEYNQIK